MPERYLTLVLSEADAKVVLSALEDCRVRKVKDGEHPSDLAPIESLISKLERLRGASYR
jgi:hypothetical protein